MKKIIYFVAIIATTLVQTAFAQHVHGNETKSAAPADKMMSKDQLSEVVSAYLSLKNALAKDDSKTAQESAQTFVAELNKVPETQMTTEQHTVWIKNMKKLTYDAQHISENELEHQREHFVTLSKNMYEVVKAFGTGTTTLYYQFCPMANDGKGAYWLSEKEKISNPYMGKKMPTCGSSKETLSAK
ncbi:MAG: DUF3347 domain-containing protein [Bacteroidia bacterium]